MFKFLSDFLKKYESSRWDLYPEFDLYMEQLLGCVGQPIDFYMNALEGMGARDLTAHMVNNYVKHGWLPHPKQRRYSREHMARLYLFRMLKGVVPLPLISNAVERLVAESSVREVADKFAELQDAAIAQIAAELEDRHGFGSASESELDYLALSLAAEANALSMISETIMRRHENDQQEKTPSSPTPNHPVRPVH